MATKKELTEKLNVLQQELDELKSNIDDALIQMLECDIDFDFIKEFCKTTKRKIPRKSYQYWVTVSLPPNETMSPKIFKSYIEEGMFGDSDYTELYDIVVTE